MSVEQMKHRCPGAKVVGKAILKDWKLVFRTHADIVQNTGSEVPVVVWQLTRWDERSLDRCEGYPIYYTKKMIEVELEGTGDKVLAMAYVMNDIQRLELPSDLYYGTIRASYIRFGFDTRFLGMALKECQKELGYEC